MQSVLTFLKGGRKQYTRKIWERIRFRLLAISRPYLTLQRHRSISGKTVIVYTMGKVGSSSVYFTLMKSFPFRKIFHNHFLSNEWLTKRLPGTPFAWNIRRAKPALKRIDQSDQQIYYICMMRDPVARDLSNLIQNYVDHDIDIHNTPLDDLKHRIMSDGHMFYKEWFDTDFAGHIGKTITSFPFDLEKGYSIHRIDSRKYLLLLKVESIDKVLEKALSEFLGIRVDPQFRFNESSGKSEAAFYGSLKKIYTLQREVLEEIYDSDVAKHFYTEEERNAMINKWMIR